MRTHRNTRHIKPVAGAAPGQAIVLLALLMVVLMAFIGLAVDGGQLFFLQRNAQNAIDAALIAAIDARCNSYDYSLDAYPNDQAHIDAVRLAATNAAAKNGFVDGQDGASVQVNIPPQSGAAQNDENYIEVIITDDTPTYFIHLVYSGPSQVTVRGVSQCAPTHIPFDLQAIVACNTELACAIDVTGSGQLNLFGAGMYSNSSKCSNEANPGPQSSVCFQGSGLAFVDDPGVATNGCTYITQPVNLAAVDDTAPQKSCEAALSIDPPDFACSGTKKPIQSSGTISPGYYAGLKLTGNANMVLEPGVYCLEAGNETNDAISANGGTLYGEGVVIYIKRGGVSISGNTDVHLYAPSHFTDDKVLNPDINTYCGDITPNLCDWAGLLFWSDSGAGSKFIFNGNGSSTFVGSVIAPHTTCVLDGSAGQLSVKSQFICDTFTTQGDAQIDIHYDPSVLFYPPPEVKVNE